MVAGKVFGICMVKNEEDIIGSVVKHMMSQVDHVIVADNLSTDYTRDILDSLTGNITIMADDDPAYRQSKKMTSLAHLAAESGAEWVVPFDADEWWVAKEGTLRDAILSSPSTVYVAPIYNYVPTSVDDQSISNPIERIGWRNSSPAPLHKVACRVTDDLIIEMGNHNATYQKGPVTYNHGSIMVKHFPYRSPEQFVNKAVQGAAALNLTDLPYEVGQHWRDYSNIYNDGGQEKLESVFWNWFYHNSPEDNVELVYDPIDINPS